MIGSRIVASVLACCILSGCGAEVPKCDNPGAIEVLKSIVRDQVALSLQAIVQPMKLVLNNPAATPEDREMVAQIDKLVSERSRGVVLVVETVTAKSFDKEVGKYTCEATLSGKLGADLIDAVKANPMFAVQIFAAQAIGIDLLEQLKSPSDSVEYTVQLTTDSKQIRVVAKGMDKVVAAYQSGISAIVMTKISELEAKGKKGAAAQGSPSALESKDQSTSLPPATPTATAALVLTPPPAAVPTPTPGVDNTPFAPSFDCSKASNDAERLICSDRDLAKFDVELSLAYSKGRGAASDKNQLKAEQLEWTKKSRNACSDKACMVASMQKRIAELSR